MCLTLLSALEELRADLHERADDISIGKLDEIIRLVEFTERKPGHLARVERLRLMARALEALPSVLYLIDRFLR